MRPEQPVCGLCQHVLRHVYTRQRDGGPMTCVRALAWACYLSYRPTMVQRPSYMRCELCRRILAEGSGLRIFVNNDAFRCDLRSVVIQSPTCMRAHALSNLRFQLLGYQNIPNEPRYPQDPSEW